MLKLAQYRYTLWCPNEWTEAQFNEALEKLELVEERITQYLRGNVITISKEITIREE